MKVIIPVAGAGTRLRPHTYTQPKPLMPVAGKAILAHIIDELLEAGMQEFVFVIGHLGEKIKNYIDDKYKTLKCTFVVQEERLGLGHAIWTARKEFKNDKSLLIVLGDTVFDMDMAQMLNSKISTLGVKEVKDPREFGVVSLDDKGFVKKVVEKPKIPHSNLALVGLYKILEVKELINALEYNIENNFQPNGEFQLADALQRMVEQGVKMTTVPVKNWFDCGKKDILLDTNRTLLEKNNIYDVDLPVFENTIIVHPVSIGEGCTLTDSIIGPYVTIGDNVHIKASIIQDSIIGSYSHLKEIILNQLTCTSKHLSRNLCR